LKEFAWDAKVIARRQARRPVVVPAARMPCPLRGLTESPVA
jgi:hypothetical protein